MIVVTGGTGFIGRRLVPRLRAAWPDEPVTCLVRDLDTPFEQAGRQVLDAVGVPCVRVDLESGRGLTAAPRSPRLVFHLGSSTETREQDHRCIDEGTRHLIEHVGPLGPECHVLFTSSMAVTDRRPDYTVPLTETSPDPDPPANAYGRAKLRAERWLREAARAQGFRLTIVRPCTVYGSGPRERGMFDSLRTLAQRGSWIARVDWPGRTGLVYVEDAVSALLGLAQRPPDPGETQQFVLYAENVTFAQICADIHRALHIPYRPIRLPRWFWASCAAVLRRKRPLEYCLPHAVYNPLWRVSLIVDDVLWADTSRLREALPDWRPRTFAEVVHEVVS